ncbi:MAG: nucleotide pyrophosphohydrolase [Bacteroidota bacterium]
MSLPQSQFHAWMDRIRDFAAARDWEQFHSLRNLSAALSVEASELLELFQWHRDGDDARYAQTDEGARRVREEVADVLIYLLRFADVAGIDLAAALDEKMRLNEAKYPADPTGRGPRGL